MGAGKAADVSPGFGACPLYLLSSFNWHERTHADVIQDSLDLDLLRSPADPRFSIPYLVTDVVQSRARLALRLNSSTDLAGVAW